MTLDDALTLFDGEFFTQPLTVRLAFYKMTRVQQTTLIKAFLSDARAARLVRRDAVDAGAVAAKALLQTQADELQVVVDSL